MRARPQGTSLVINGLQSPGEQTPFQLLKVPLDGGSWRLSIRHQFRGIGIKAQVMRVELEIAAGSYSRFIPLTLWPDSELVVDFIAEHLRVNLREWRDPAAVSAEFTTFPADIRCQLHPIKNLVFTAWPNIVAQQTQDTDLFGPGFSEMTPTGVYTVDFSPYSDQIKFDVRGTATPIAPISVGFGVSELDLKGASHNVLSLVEMSVGNNSGKSSGWIGIEGAPLYRPSWWLNGAPLGGVDEWVARCIERIRTL